MSPYLNICIGFNGLEQGVHSMFDVAPGTLIYTNSQLSHRVLMSLHSRNMPYVFQSMKIKKAVVRRWAKVMLETGDWICLLLSLGEGKLTDTFFLQLIN